MKLKANNYIRRYFSFKGVQSKRSTALAYGHIWIVFNYPPYGTCYQYKRVSTYASRCVKRADPRWLSRSTTRERIEKILGISYY